MKPYNMMIINDAIEQKDTITCTIFIVNEETLDVLYTEGFKVKTKAELDAYAEKVKWRFLRCI